MSWTPSRRFRYVTVLDDAVPPDRLDVLVARLLRDFVDPGGRVIVSSYTDAGQPPRRLFDDLRAAVIHLTGSFTSTGRAEPHR